VVNDAMGPYFQDAYDHVLRAAEWTESLRDLVTSVLETNLTIQGNRLNVITKRVTSWAAIIAVPPPSPASTDNRALPRVSAGHPASTHPHS
jgi:magnesium transporter